MKPEPSPITVVSNDATAAPFSTPVDRSASVSQVADSSSGPAGIVIVFTRPSSSQQLRLDAIAH